MSPPREAHHIGFLSKMIVPNREQLCIEMSIFIIDNHHIINAKYEFNNNFNIHIIGNLHPLHFQLNDVLQFLLDHQHIVLIYGNLVVSDLNKTHHFEV